MKSSKSLPSRIRRAKQTRRPIDQVPPLDRQWRKVFLTTLAETSNVTLACQRAGAERPTVYDLRRRDADFAAKWADALCEGYDNLEIELLQRLRSGDSADDPKFNHAVALRMLQQHRATVAKEKARRANVTALSVRASLDRKVAEMRALILADRILVEQAQAKGEVGDDSQ